MHGLEVKLTEVSYKSQTFCTKVYVAVLSSPLTDFNTIWYNGIYRSKEILSTNPKLGHGSEVKVTDLDFSYQCQNICLYIKTLIDFTGDDSLNIFIFILRYTT